MALSVNSSSRSIIDNEIRILVTYRNDKNMAILLHEKQRSLTSPKSDALRKK